MTLAAYVLFCVVCWLLEALVPAVLISFGVCSVLISREHAGAMRHAKSKMARKYCPEAFNEIWWRDRISWIFVVVAVVNFAVAYIFWLPLLFM